MSLTDLIALDLKGGRSPEAGAGAPGVAAASRAADPLVDLRALIVRALHLVRELVAAEGEDEDVALLAELEQLAAAYAAMPGSGPLANESACFDRVRGVAARTRKRRLEQRQELAAIVSLVREAVATAGSELESIHSQIEASGDRFAKITDLEDPKQVKAQVMAQVALLKQLVAERRVAWESQRQTFADRIASLEQQLHVTKRQAALDGLTGVANQRSFQDEYEARVGRTGSQLVLAILDVDGFKAVNDTRGHAEGDRVLKALASGLRLGVREGDFVARVGGDEFAVLLDRVTLRQAEIRFTALLAKIRPDMAQGYAAAAAPAVSCGLAELSAGDTPASLYQRADEALYAAKRAGRNRVATRTRPLMRDLLRR
jgi:diguanylate cyclase (GGDEF)-like protein